MIEPNVEIEGRGNMTGKEEEVSLTVGVHLEGRRPWQWRRSPWRWLPRRSWRCSTRPEWICTRMIILGTRLPGRLDFLHVIITLWKPKTLGLNAKILDVHTVLKH